MCIIQFIHRNRPQRTSQTSPTSTNYDLNSMRQLTLPWSPKSIQVQIPTTPDATHTKPTHMSKLDVTPHCIPKLGPCYKLIFSPTQSPNPPVRVGRTYQTQFISYWKTNTVKAATNSKRAKNHSEYQAHKLKLTNIVQLVFPFQAHATIPKCSSNCWCVVLLCVA